MSHELSLRCYQEARNDPGIHPEQYADLETLVQLLGLVEPGSAPAPVERFTFPAQPPELLLIDDELGIIEVWRDDLVRGEYPEEAMRIFTSGEEAAAYVKAHSVEICLLDVQLLSPYSVLGEYTSGIRILRAIKAQSPGAKVILISGFVTEAMAREAILELGATYHLKKPFRMSDVRIIVQWAIDQLGSRQ